MAASPSTLSLLLMPLLFSLSRAATFDIVNQCTIPIWPAALPGGGRRLDRGQTWSLNVNPGTAGGRIWARTGCNFDGSGGGSCQTGDCGGRLECQLSGAPPTTLAEYSLNQPNNLDYYDISVIDGFNVPMSFSPTKGGCANLRCSADVNGQCPSQQRATAEQTLNEQLETNPTTERVQLENQVYREISGLEHHSRVHLQGIGVTPSQFYEHHRQSFVASSHDATYDELRRQQEAAMKEMQQKYDAETREDRLYVPESLPHEIPPANLGEGTSKDPFLNYRDVDPYREDNEEEQEDEEEQEEMDDED
ncbi:thaumatin-like protein [Canna indica]|uniref:Thaumatin-like protein n=1 Tax=Canna indica TaxID=4628 RepID=A0AAQ3Q884_9LILI|nr:thaumatin-like protein [Canna indica]